jgi:hypothetical protein
MKIELQTPSIYDLRIIVNEDRPSYTVESNGSVGFNGVANEETPKVYVVAINDLCGSVVYVGSTMDSMQSRFQSGFRKIEDGNNRNYTWALEPARFKLYIWDIKELVNGNDDTLRIIEAEFTVSVRIMQKAWPIKQKSITFYHFMLVNSAKMAGLISIEMIGQYYDALVARKRLTKEDIQKIQKEKLETIDFLKTINSRS